MNQIINIVPSKWVRSRSDCWLTGVSGGLAKQFDIPSWVVRLFWILLTTFTFGFGILAYLACVISFPKENRTNEPSERMIFGVCKKIAARIDLELGLVRLLALILLFISGGSALIGYIVLYFVLSEKKDQ
ncbi:MAG: PspC domain-containing protein [Bdellovibrionales bacterium]|nr:PspC domain-containing protein [Bdellovibrionales bacterium]